VINSYTMIAICPILFLAWKVLKRSKFYKPEEVDLLKNLDEIEEYEATYVPRPAKYVISSPSNSRMVSAN
jgi:amino acid transporter